MCTVVVTSPATKQIPAKLEQPHWNTTLPTKHTSQHNLQTHFSLKDTLREIFFCVKTGCHVRALVTSGDVTDTFQEKNAHITVENNKFN